MTARLRPAAIHHCPFCAEQDLWPVTEPDHGWKCQSCTRTFVVQAWGGNDESLIPGRVDPSTIHREDQA
ncbi:MULTISPECIES: hypothetical protein [unclassified Janibacter]|uniref:hypothetical protein n=1 Tax=unclassified Janibacter TaxID=2649294 RepID=UPI003D04B8AA